MAKEQAQWLGTPGEYRMVTMEFSSPPKLQGPQSPASQSKTRSAGKCGYCRGKHKRTPDKCSSQNCQRRFHPTCHRGELRDLCSDCAQVCAKCWQPLITPVLCSYCKLGFHEACAPLLDSLDQLCPLCIKEQLMGGIDHCIEMETRKNKTYHVVKFTFVSWIHRCRIKASECTAKSHCMKYFERSLFIILDKERNLYGCHQFEGYMKEDGKLYWEPLETIVTYNEQLEKELTPVKEEYRSQLPSDQVILLSDDEEAPESRPTPVTITPTAVYQARDLLLATGYCPHHPDRLQAAMQANEIMDDSEGTLRRLCQEIYEASVQGQSTLQCHGVPVNCDEVRLACLHLFALQIGWRHAEKYGVLSSSRRYAESFIGYPCWKPAYDNLIVALALNSGPKAAFRSLQKYKPLPEWHLCIYPEATSEVNSEQQTQDFIEARLRFLAYCLVYTLNES